MTNKEFYSKLIEVEEIQENHSDFYELAEKYGFNTPWDNILGRSSTGRTIGFDL